jgi:hypothetical protein
LRFTQPGDVLVVVAQQLPYLALIRTADRTNISDRIMFVPPWKLLVAASRSIKKVAEAVQIFVSAWPRSHDSLCKLPGQPAATPLPESRLDQDWPVAAAHSPELSWTFSAALHRFRPLAIPAERSQSRERSRIT